MGDGMDDLIALIEEIGHLRHDADRQAARIAEVEAALRPFADWAENYDDMRAGERMVEAYFRAGDLRRARAALASERKQDGGNDG
jgi:hypothetical protein